MGWLIIFFSCLKIRSRIFLTEDFQDAWVPKFLLPTDFKHSDRKYEAYRESLSILEEYG